MNIKKEYINMIETGTRKETKKNEKRTLLLEQEKKKNTQIRIIGTGRHRRGGLRICLA